MITIGLNLTVEEELTNLNLSHHTVGCRGEQKY